MLIVISKVKICSEALIDYSVRLFCGLFDKKNKNTTPVILRKEGRPYIDNIDINVSVSHSNDITVCAVSKDTVGIDIEYITDRDYKKIAARFFETEPDSLLDFYKLWTAKESYKKASDIPLIKALKNTEYKRIKNFNIIKDYALSVYGEDNICFSFYFNDIIKTN